MEYISSKEAAALWSISERLVQRYCTENRIPGAKKFGHYWMIPAEAEKPTKKVQKTPTKSTYTPSLPFNDPCIVCLPEWKVPGEAEQVLAKLPGDTARLFEMELEYYRGQADRAQTLCRELLKDAQSNEARLACWQTLALCAIYNGSYLDWEDALNAISALPAWRDESEALKELSIAAVRLSFVDLSTIPEWLKSADFECLPGNGSFLAVFVHIKWLQQAGKLEAAKYALKMALTRNDFAQNPIARSYFELTLASLTHTLNDDKAAKEHMRTALTYILPDRLYGILVENRGWVDSLLMDVMLEDGLDEQWRTVVRLYEPYKEGWMRLGKQIIGKQWVADLTPREWEVLKHASAGLSTTEISERMYISAASVKKYLGTVYNKLCINGRNDIKALLPFVGTGESEKK